MRFGMVGLGRMGSGLVKRALLAGHECVVYNRHRDRVDALAASGAEGATSLQDLAVRLQPPRVVWLMIPAEATGELVAEFAGLLEPGDAIIDGGNSHYRDSAERAARLAQLGIGFVDVGTSGGVFGLERGFCLMIGGDEALVRRLEPLFRSLAPGAEAAPRTPGRSGPFSAAELGYLHCGSS
ncbi:MAG: NAD(P)-binding domain-containing protein, partial [Bauldia sp.]